MTNTFHLDKNELIRRETLRIKETLTGGTWTVKEKVALSCRTLYRHGHNSGLSGQITARAEVVGTFITQRFGLGFDEVSVSNLLVVDEDLHVLEGEGMPNPANRFHAWIYRARPDVTCVIHTHPLYTSALSMLEIPMQIAHMDACVLYDNIAFLSDWPGVPVGNSEGEIISAALGEKRSLLLAHHGLIVVGKNVEEACVLAVQFERAAKLYMLASSVGKICDIDAKLGKEARDWILQDPRTSSIFAYFARQTISADPACLSACEHSL